MVDRGRTGLLCLELLAEQLCLSRLAAHDICHAFGEVGEPAFWVEVCRSRIVCRLQGLEDCLEGV